MRPGRATLGGMHGPTLFDDLLPPGTVVVEASAAMWEQGLWPQEQALVQHAVPRRQREFTAGRNCARQALRRLGQAEVAILTGPQREPLWPEAVRGSITHTQGYCAAALLPASAGWSIGIDAEADATLSEDARRLVLCDAEVLHLAELTRLHPGPAWDKLVFSAKESFHKALFPRWPVVLDFLDARVQVHPASHSLQVHLSDPAQARQAGAAVFSGRFRFAQGLVLSAVALACAPRASATD
jgi:4'-phosphopantetheinyl transferase EntD